jgi:hypothetical protein
MSLRLVEIIMVLLLFQVECETDDLWRKSPALLGAKSQEQRLSISSPAQRYGGKARHEVCPFRVLANYCQVIHPGNSSKVGLRSADSEGSANGSRIRGQ